MKYSARTRSPRLSAALLPLLFAPVPALLAQNASAPVAVPGDVRALLRDAQAAALPSASVITQEIGAVSVAPAFSLKNGLSASGVLATSLRHRTLPAWSKAHTACFSLPRSIPIVI